MIWLAAYVLGFIVLFYLAFRFTVVHDPFEEATWFSIFFGLYIGIIWPAGWLVLLIVWLIETDFEFDSRFPQWLADVMRVSK